MDPGAVTWATNSNPGHEEQKGTVVSDTLKLTDDDITTTFHAGSTAAQSPRLQDADGTDADGADADGEDGDASDGDATDATDGDGSDADGTDADGTDS